MLRTCAYINTLQFTMNIVYNEYLQFFVNIVELSQMSGMFYNILLRSTFILE